MTPFGPFEILLRCAHFAYLYVIARSGPGQGAVRGILLQWKIRGQLEGGGGGRGSLDRFMWMGSGWGGGEGRRLAGKRKERGG